MYLLDTDVLSALRRRDRNVAVAHWAARVDESDLHTSVATMHEIEKGIQRQRRYDPDHAATLEAWLNRIILQFGDSVLPITTPIARRWAHLTASNGYDDLDFAIAATALEHGLIVVTRNVRDFSRTGVTVHDPFEGKTHKAK